MPPRLTLASVESLVLDHGNTVPGVGVYVGALVLEGGVAQIAAITSNQANLYYDPTRTENAYLGGLHYALPGGGELAPVD